MKLSQGQQENAAPAERDLKWIRIHVDPVLLSRPGAPFL